MLLTNWICDQVIQHKQLCHQVAFKLYLLGLFCAVTFSQNMCLFTDCVLSTFHTSKNLTTQLFNSSVYRPRFSPTSRTHCLKHIINHKDLLCLTFMFPEEPRLVCVICFQKIFVYVEIAWIQLFPCVLAFYSGNFRSEMSLFFCTSWLVWTGFHSKSETSLCLLIRCV